MLRAKEIKGSKTYAAFLCGTSLAGAWYFVADALITHPLSELVAVLPAIGIAAAIPAYLNKNRDIQTAERASDPLSQRLEVLSKHAIINVVDTRHCIAEVNAEFETSTGYTQAEVLGKPVNMLYFDNDARVCADKIRQGLMQGRTWQGETALRRKDGTLLLTHTTVIPIFDPDGTWAGSITARTDMTRINQLMVEEETVQTLDELRDDIWIVDAETENFTYINKAASTRIGWDRDTARQMTLADLDDANTATVIGKACRALAASDEDITHFQAELMGTPFDVSIKYLCMEKKRTRYLVMFNDISGRLVEEQKKSEFISMVSHELRSPLTSIKGSMGLLLSNAAGEIPQKAVSLLEIAHRNADRLVLIINDILDLEKISAGQMDLDVQPVDLSELVAETNNANSMLQQRFALNVFVSGVDQAIPLNTDPNRIIQVITNLLSNACKFSRPGGRIDIAVENGKDNVRVSVRDEGPGIAEQDQHKIFERFADLENSDRAGKGGTGLGLSICKAIVEGLGGSIGFETEEGVGTTFYFVLPKEYEVGHADQEETLKMRRHAS